MKPIGPFEWLLIVFFLVAPVFWWRAVYVLSKAWRYASTLPEAKVGLLRHNILGAASGAVAATLLAVLGLIRVLDIVPPESSTLILALALILFTAPAIAFEVLLRTGHLVD